MLLGDGRELRLRQHRRGAQKPASGKGHETHTIRAYVAGTHPPKENDVDPLAGQPRAQRQSTNRSLPQRHAGDAAQLTRLRESRLFEELAYGLLVSERENRQKAFDDVPAEPAFQRLRNCRVAWPNYAIDFPESSAVYHVGTQELLQVYAVAGK